jgi:hypothetical protein
VGSKKRHSRTYSSNGASCGRASMSFIMEESKDLPMKREEVDDEPFIANNTEKVFEMAKGSISPDRTFGITDYTTKPTNNDYSPKETKTSNFGTIL